jgi:hypothetical protein
MIPEAAVETTARFLSDCFGTGAGNWEWHVDGARQLLEEVAPHIRAQALKDAADKVMGPSDVLLDAATCRWIAMEMRERAAAERGQP